MKSNGTNTKNASHAAVTRKQRTHGARALEPGNLREARRQPEDRRDARELDLQLGLLPAQDEHRRVLAVLAFVRA
jgi:hypothetical protein